MPSASRRLLNFLGLSAGAAAAYYLAQYARRTLPLERTRVIAHRGGPRYAPENTLAAFIHAALTGAEMLECDVQMTRDGALVILHDETLDRTTNGAGLVGQQTLAEVRALDAGDGERVPTFREYIEAGKAYHVELLIELKSPHLYPGLEAKVLDELQAADYLDHSVLQSFDWDSLRRLRQLNPHARLGALYDLGVLDVSWPPADAEYICPPAESVLINPGLIRQAHLEGRQVFVWFGKVENALTYRFLAAFGADGIIADDPIALQKAVGTLRGQ
jgi:glycerophosphoryl diester phosphodiesterase